MQGRCELVIDNEILNKLAKQTWGHDAYLIILLDVCSAPSVSYQVDAFRGVLYKHNLSASACMNEVCDFVSGLLISCCGP